MDVEQTMVPDFAETPAPISAGMVAIGVISTSVGIICVLFDRHLFGIFLAWSAIACCSGSVMALLERSTRGAITNLKTSIALLAGNLLAIWAASEAHPALLLPLAYCGVFAAIAPFIARRLARPDVSAPKYFAAFWLLPAFLPMLALACIPVAQGKPLDLLRIMRFFLLVLLGPWATQAGRLCALPEAGSVFSLFLAIFFSGILAVLLLAAIFGRR